MITSKKVFGAYVVERVSYDAFASAATTSPADSFINSRNCAIGDEWTACELVSIQPYNHDTSIFRFKLPHGKIHLNLPIGGFLLALAPNCEHGGGDAIRPYTSVQDDVTNSNKEYGTFELLCKRYDQWGVKESIQTHFLFTKTNHSYRPAGAVSNYIHKLKVGDSLKFKCMESILRVFGCLLYYFICIRFNSMHWKNSLPFCRREVSYLNSGWSGYSSDDSDITWDFQIQRLSSPHI